MHIQLRLVLSINALLRICHAATLGKECCVLPNSALHDPICIQQIAALAPASSQLTLDTDLLLKHAYVLAVVPQATSSGMVNQDTTTWGCWLTSRQPFPGAMSFRKAKVLQSDGKGGDCLKLSHVSTPRSLCRCNKSPALPHSAQQSHQRKHVLISTCKAGIEHTFGTAIVWALTSKICKQCSNLTRPDSRLNLSRTMRMPMHRIGPAKGWSCCSMINYPLEELRQASHVDLEQCHSSALASSLGWCLTSRT